MRCVAQETTELGELADEIAGGQPMLRHRGEPCSMLIEIVAPGDDDGAEMLARDAADDGVELFESIDETKAPLTGQPFSDSARLPRDRSAGAAGFASPPDTGASVLRR